MAADPQTRRSSQPRGAQPEEEPAVRERLRGAQAQPRGRRRCRGGVGTRARSAGRLAAAGPGAGLQGSAGFERLVWALLEGLASLAMGELSATSGEGDAGLRRRCVREPADRCIVFRKRAQTMLSFNKSLSSEEPLK